MVRWSLLALPLVVACDQAHVECVDADGEVAAAADVDCADVADDLAGALADVEDDCDGACTCRLVTDGCETEEAEE